MSQHIICLIGNPNCGKTTLFNALTGSRQRVGNWPGVTVDKKNGNFSYDNHDIEVVDLPGIYSVTPTSVSGEDEVVARDYLLSGEAQVVVNIIDASNLERNLYLTSQLIEMQVPMLVVVNMLDIARQHKIKLDLDALQKELGCPVVGLVANRNKGIEELKQALVQFLDDPVSTHINVRYNAVIEKAVEEISGHLALEKTSRWFAIQFLEHAPGIENKFEGKDLSQVRQLVEQTDKHFEGNTDIEITNSRYELVSNISEKVIVREGDVTGTLTDKIDRVILNRWMGLPIFLLIMYVTFLFTQNFGAVFIDFFDILVGGIFVDGLGQLLASWGTPEWLTVFLSNGIGGGLQTISTFNPGRLLHVPFLSDSGRVRLHGSSRFCDGPLNACARTSGQSLCAAFGWLRLQRPRHHGHTHNGSRKRPHHHRYDDALYELRRAFTRLRSFRNRFLAHKRSKLGFRFVSYRYCRSHFDGFSAQTHSSAECSERFCDGNASVSHSDFEGRDASHMGPRPHVHVPCR